MSTPAYEIPLHRNAAVDNLKREIRLLEERQKQWEIEIKTMVEQIKLTINSLDLTTEERDHFYINEIQKGEETNVYQQISGTAIGIKFAPPYACMFMDQVKSKFLQTQKFQPLVGFRYIDDIFFI